MKNRPIRVLHVLRIMNRAGIETWIMHLLRHFDRREIAIDVLVNSDQPGAYDEEIRALGARLLYCLRPHQPWRYGRDFLRVLRENGPYDVVQSHNYFFSGLDLRLATQAGVRTRIAHIHPVRDIDEGRIFRSLYRRLMANWISRYSDLVLTPSHASLEAFSKYADLSAKPHFVVRNCVGPAVLSGHRDRAAARLELGLPVDIPVITYVARFEPHKNHRLAVAVADQLASSGVRAHFALAGTEGGARHELEKQISGRSDFSVFVNMEDVVPLLECSDLFFFPSNEEGFGTVAIEAAAAGIPVVATDLPGIREACCPPQREFMFAQDDVASATESVRRILTNPELAVRLKAAGTEWAAQFSVESVGKQLCEIYEARSRDSRVPEMVLQ